MINSISLIFLSYLLGSIPFGFIITYLSTGKNILEIGWKKTSGSNVFKNVGLWQGFLTGILDVGKGFLAVKLAKYFNFSIQTQIFCGIAAVFGHNWSIFLKFAGGRGIGTFIGAFSLLSPKILGLALIPFLVMGIIWNLSIGTIFFLGTIIFLAHCSKQPQIEKFVLISLIPIFLKRLSPIEEIKKSSRKKDLIINRLIFDRNSPSFELRIKKIINRLTKR